MFEACSVTGVKFEKSFMLPLKLLVVLHKIHFNYLKWWICSRTCQHAFMVRIKCIIYSKPENMNLVHFHISLQTQCSLRNRKGLTEISHIWVALRFHSFHIILYCHFNIFFLILWINSSLQHKVKPVCVFIFRICSTLDPLYSSFSRTLAKEKMDIWNLAGPYLVHLFLIIGTNSYLILCTYQSYFPPIFGMTSTAV